MRYWVQFVTMSTGYIAGTIPPQFGTPQRIDACGSDGTQPLDGRLSTENMRREALRRAQRSEHWKRYAGFHIVSGPRFAEEKLRGPFHPLTYPIQTN